MLVINKSQIHALIKRKQNSSCTFSTWGRIFKKNILMLFFRGDRTFVSSLFEIHRPPVRTSRHYLQSAFHLQS
uniref:Uncharacterized protein n=1 Tax=Anguilla anguilla TaxID=7936 RepID=A0A0E9US91_ANGAN